MRCFIAIDIDEEIRAGLRKVQQEIAGQGNIRRSDVKWVRPESMHLTLKFLGEIKDREVVDVCRIVEMVAGRHKTFALAIKEVGHFGSRSARVLWVGAGLDCPELAQLQQDLENELATAGWPKESRKFSGPFDVVPRAKYAKAGIRTGPDNGTIQGRRPRHRAVSRRSAVYQSQRCEPEGPMYTAC